LKGEKCQWENCNNISTSRSIYCSIHQKEHRKKVSKAWKENIRITTHQPVSARKNADTYALWKFALTITHDEITVLIKKRKHELKYEKDHTRIQQLRTEILVLEKAYTERKTEHDNDWFINKDWKKKD